MAALRPVAFDIETTGFEPEARLTVAGLAIGSTCWQVLNTAGQPADAVELNARLAERADRSLSIDIVPDEQAVLGTLARNTAEQFDPDSHYLCGFNGETWRNGFDLPFLRTVCARHDIAWPFPDMAYADVRTMTARFNTGDDSDLESVHGALVDAECRDPFADSAEAVTAFETGNWLDLLAHNLADLRRTYDLAVLAGQYVPKSDFEMKNLAPPGESD